MKLGLRPKTQLSNCQMNQINTIEKFHQFLNSIENVSVKINELECEIYISNSLIAKGKAIAIDTNPFEISELLQSSEHTTIENFFFNEKKIFYSDSRLEIEMPSGNINRFIEHIFYKYPSIEPLEYSIAEQSNELNYTISQLTSDLLELRIANNNNKQDLIQKNSELYEIKTKIKEYEDKVQQLLNSADKKEKLIVPAIQFLVKNLDCISSRQHKSICEYEQAHQDKITNKTVFFYENDSMVAFSFNQLIYHEYRGLDLVGLEMPPEISPKRTFIIFDSNGMQIDKLDFETFNKKFELDWESFKQIQFL